MVVSGCCSSVAEHWWFKQEALGSTPGSTTFLSSTLPLTIRKASFVRIVSKNVFGTISRGNGPLFSTFVLFATLPG